MQFDDIKKQLPFTVSSTDAEYLGLVSIKINGVSDDLLNAYAKFGIIPLVVGG